MTIAAAEVVANLFLAREIAHREHLRTKSYAQHMALGDFYESVIDVADKFAEVYQGTYGIIDSIPYKVPEKKEAVDSALEDILEKLEDSRVQFDQPCDTPLLNILDDVGALFAQTLYKLRNLK